jgi:hypothetical protein
MTSRIFLAFLTLSIVFLSSCGGDDPNPESGYFTVYGKKYDLNRAQIFPRLTPINTWSGGADIYDTELLFNGADHTYLMISLMSGTQQLKSGTYYFRKDEIDPFVGKISGFRVMYGAPDLLLTSTDLPAEGSITVSVKGSLHIFDLNANFGGFDVTFRYEGNPHIWSPT